MGNILARVIAGTLATASAQSPSFACGQFESWLTDEEIAIAKAGGDVPFRGYGYAPMSPLPHIQFAFPLIGNAATEFDTIADAQSQVMAAADQPFDVTPSAVVPLEHAASTDEQAPSAPPDEPSNMKKVIIACDGGITVSPTLL